MGRDHSCEGCGRGGFNDPGGVCECPQQEERRWPDGFAPSSPLSNAEVEEAVQAAMADGLNEVYMSRADSATVWAEVAHRFESALQSERRRREEAEEALEEERAGRSLLARTTDEARRAEAERDAALQREEELRSALTWIQHTAAEIDEEGIETAASNALAGAWDDRERNQGRESSDG